MTSSPTPAVLPDARALIESAKQRRAARDASGEVYVDSSIYEGMAACLVRSGRTIAHVVDYADAVAIAAAMATPAASDAAVPAGALDLATIEACASYLDERAANARIAESKARDEGYVEDAVMHARIGNALRSAATAIRTLGATSNAATDRGVSAHSRSLGA